MKLEIVEVRKGTLWGFNGDPAEYHAKGDHQPERFVSELETQFKRTCQPEVVKQGHFRKVPRDIGTQWLLTEPGRGTFLSTYVDARDTLPLASAQEGEVA